MKLPGNKDACKKKVKEYKVKRNRKFLRGESSSWRPCVRNPGEIKGWVGPDQVLKLHLVILGRPAEQPLGVLGAQRWGYARCKKVQLLGKWEPALVFRCVASSVW